MNQDELQAKMEKEIEGLRSAIIVLASFQGLPNDIIVKLNDLTKGE